MHQRNKRVQQWTEHFLVFSRMYHRLLSLRWKRLAHCELRPLSRRIHSAHSLAKISHSKPRFRSRYGQQQTRKPTRKRHTPSRPGSVSDVFKYNPWRAPGLAPVFDSCGMAGGAKIPSTAAAEYTSTVFASQGDLGSQVLKARPSGTVWVRGGVATVRQQATAPHGGVSCVYVCMCVCMYVYM